ncbi:unnamed protein product, partial [Mesorhabditis spiculigera]
MKSADTVFLAILLPIVSSLNLDEVLVGVAVPHYIEGVMNDRGNTECGLPSFTNALPLQYRRNLRRVWANFPLGSKSCAMELRQTKAILEGLPMEIREKAFKNPRYTPSTAALLPGTPFLASLTSEQQEQLTKLTSDGRIEEPERIELLKAWAVDHLEPKAQARFEQTLRFLTAKASRFQEKVAALSAEARLAINRLEDLRKQKMAVINRLSLNAKKELGVIWKQKCNSPDGIDPDLQPIACSSETESAPTTATTRTTTTKAMPLSSRIEMVTTTTPTSTQTSSTGFPILIETTQNPLEYSTVPSTMVTSETTQIEEKVSSKSDIQVFRKTSSIYNIVTPRPDVGGNTEPPTGPAVVSASMPPSMFASMDREQLSAII